MFKYWTNLDGTNGEWTKPHKNAYRPSALVLGNSLRLIIYSRFGQETIIGYGWHLMLNSLRDQCSCGVQSWSFKACPILYGDDAVQLDQHTNGEPISLSGEVHPFLYGLFAFSCRWKICMMRLQAALLLRLWMWHWKWLVQEQPKVVSLFIEIFQGLGFDTS